MLLSLYANRVYMKTLGGLEETRKEITITTQNVWRLPALILESYPNRTRILPTLNEITLHTIRVSNSRNCILNHPTLEFLSKSNAGRV